MNKIMKYWSLTVYCLLVVLVSSCIQDDDQVEKNNGTASLTVKFSTRSGTYANSVIEEQEGIHTLRLILVQEGKVVSNYKATFGTEANNPLETQEIRFLKFPKKNTTIYAIANEESVEEKPGDLKLDEVYKIGMVFEASSLLDKVIDNSNRKFFPKTANTLKRDGKYLPMTGMATCNMNNIQDEVSVSVSLIRMVAKLRITFVNQTGMVLPIKQIRFGNFWANKSYLFDKQQQLPDNVGYGGENYIQANERDEIPVGGEATLIDYICESAAGEDAYKLGLNDLTDFPLMNILDENKKKITAIYRNTCVDIRATAYPMGWDLTCKTLPWDVEENSVDYKTQLSWTAGIWERNTILDQDGNKIHLDPSLEAKMTFTIATPEGTEWRAELTDKTNFEFVGSSEGKIEYIDGQPQLQTIKVKVKDSTSDDRFSTQLKVFAIIGNGGEGAGTSYELDITKGGQSNPTEGDVNRFILEQYK